MTSIEDAEAYLQAEIDKFGVDLDKLLKSMEPIDLDKLIHKSEERSG